MPHKEKRVESGRNLHVGMHVSRIGNYFSKDMRNILPDETRRSALPGKSKQWRAGIHIGSPDQAARFIHKKAKFRTVSVLRINESEETMQFFAYTTKAKLFFNACEKHTIQTERNIRFM